MHVVKCSDFSAGTDYSACTLHVHTAYMSYYASLSPPSLLPPSLPSLLQLTQEQLSQQEQELRQLLEAPQPVELHQHLPGRERKEEEEEREGDNCPPYPSV